MWTWLLTTKVGRSVAATALVAITLAASWYFFSTHYYDAGYAAREAEYLRDQNKANVDQGKKNIDNNATSGKIAKESSAEARDALAKIDEAKTKSKESTHEVYKKPPVTAPVALGSCVHPVDDRVQKRISAARAAAGG